MARVSNPPYGKSWKSDLERMGGKSIVKNTDAPVDNEADDPIEEVADAE